MPDTQVTKRVKYKKSPLTNVIFQLRFPTILAIGAKKPEKFQELVMGKYPYYDEALEQQNGFTLSSSGVPTPINKQSVNYQFKSEDEKTKINLTPSFISLSTQGYTQWENFREEIKFAVNAFEHVYNPAFYSRVGLRYEDVISRKKLGLEDKKWSDLIQPHILGIMSKEYEDGIRSFSSVSEFNNGNGTLTRTHFELVQANNDPEILFLIDCDYFAPSKTAKSEMMSTAECLHANSASFIRNAITDELHQAMEPVDIEVKSDV